MLLRKQCILWNLDWFLMHWHIKRLLLYLASISWKIGIYPQDFNFYHSTLFLQPERHHRPSHQSPPLVCCRGVTLLTWLRDGKTNKKHFAVDFFTSWFQSRSSKHQGKKIKSGTSSVPTISYFRTTVCRKDSAIKISSLYSWTNLD